MKRYIRVNAPGGTGSTDGFEVLGLALSTRARNLLDRLNIKTLGDLRHFGALNIRDTKGCGRKTFEEIAGEIDKLETMGPEKYAALARSQNDGANPAGAGVDTGAALQLLLAELGRSGFISSSHAQRILGLDSFGVRPLLRLLVDRGLAVKEGRRRGMRYVRATQ